MENKLFYVFDEEWVNMMLLCKENDPLKPTLYEDKYLIQLKEFADEDFRCGIVLAKVDEVKTGHYEWYDVVSSNGAYLDEWGYVRFENE